MACSSSASGSDARPFIRTARLAKQYQRGHSPVYALRDVSLEVADAQFVGVVGPSGSGKSTLLHLLAALEAPSSGTLQVGSWSLGALSSAERVRYRRTMVGLVFQEFHLVPTMTAHENVALPMILAGVDPAERAERARSVLTQVGLSDRLDHHPAELSGGEQQRVATARALVGTPPLLLADEPTGNLDADTGAQIIDLLARMHQEHACTVIVVTHHAEEIRPVADRIVRLRDGTLASPRTDTG